MNDSSDHFLDGTILDSRYEVLSCLGKGASSSVYKVQDQLLNRTLALKIIHKDLLSDTSAIERFRQEAINGFKLEHPNLVRTYSSGLANDGRLYIVMDLLEGETLSTLLKRKERLQLSSFFKIFIQLADGLIYLHDQGIVHRDLKPGNILICNENGSEKVFILDFGIAKYIYLSNSEQAATKTGALLGTSAYMSPEQCRGSEIDARADIYSLACIMYECLAGSTPFEGANPFETMYNQMNVSLNRLAFFRNLPSPLAKMLRKGLEKQPEARYQSMAELKQALQDCAEIQDTLQRRLLEKGEKSSSAKRLLLPITASVIAIVLVFLFCFSAKQKSEYAKNEKFKASLKRKEAELGPVKSLKYVPAAKNAFLQMVENYSKSPTYANEISKLYLRWIKENSERSDLDQETKIDIFRRYADYLRSRFDNKEALPYYVKLENLEKTDASKLRLENIRACVLLDEKKPKEASKLLDSVQEKLNAAKLSPKESLEIHSLLYQTKGDSEYQQQNYESAGKAYQQALNYQLQFLKGPYLPNEDLAKKMVKCLAKQGKQKEIPKFLKWLQEQIPEFKERDTDRCAGLALLEIEDIKNGKIYMDRLAKSLKAEEHWAQLELMINFQYSVLDKMGRQNEAAILLAEKLEYSPNQESRMAIYNAIFNQLTDPKLQSKYAETSYKELQSTESITQLLASTGEALWATPIINKATAFQNSSKTEEAIKLLSNWITRIRTDCPVKAILQQHLGQTYYSTHRLPEAESVLSKVLKFWEDSDNWQEFPAIDSSQAAARKIIVEGTLAHVLLDQRKAEEALQICTRGLDSNSFANKEPGRNLLRAKALALKQVHRNEEAEQVYRKCLELISKSNTKNKAEDMQDFYDYSMFLIENNRHSDAEPVLKRLLSTQLKFLGDTMASYDTRVHLSECRSVSGDFKGAVPYLKDALSTAEKCSAQAQIFDSTTRLAHNLLHAAEFKESEACFKQALKIAPAREIPGIYCSLAAVYKGLNKQSLRLEALNMGLESATKNKAIDSQLQLLRDKSNYYLELQNLKEALKCLQNIEELYSTSAKDNSNKLQLAADLNLRAEIHLQSKELEKTGHDFRLAAEMYQSLSPEADTRQLRGILERWLVVSLHDSKAGDPAEIKKRLKALN